MHAGRHLGGRAGGQAHIGRQADRHARSGWSGLAVQLLSILVQGAGWEQLGCALCSTHLRATCQCECFGSALHLLMMPALLCIVFVLGAWMHECMLCHGPVCLASGRWWRS